MKLPSFSIAMLCGLVSVAAVDLAWMRHVDAVHASILGFRGPALDAGALPVANYVALAMVRVAADRGRSSRARAWALVGGVLGLALYLGYGRACYHLSQATVFATMGPIYGARRRWPVLDVPYYLYYADAVYYTALQLPIILGAWWLGRRADRRAAGEP